MAADAGRHRRLRAVFDQAVLLGGNERDAFLDRACDGDAELRAQAARLIAAHYATTPFLEHPARLPSTSDDVGEFPGTARFRILSTLGRGGMGVVYQAHDADRDEIVALKTLRRSAAVDLYRLKREFRSLADVAHPNIVCLYELFVENDRPFFTMELVDGVPFVDFVRGGADGWLDVERFVAVTSQLVEGVRALHRCGMLHRDLKPSNVLVTRDGRVVILDFGLIADRASRRTGDTIDGGTPAYMAPEEAAGSPPSEAGDWYGVGATIYESLTGRLPFSGSITDILRRKQLDDPTAPADLVKAIPPALSTLCMGLLHRDPDQRLNGDEAVAELTGAAVTTDRSPARTVFIGRREQLRVLEEAAAATDSGEPRTVAIHGLSGIGKSTVVRTFIDQIPQGHDPTVLAGRCYENESVPYKGLDGVVDELSRHLSAMAEIEVQPLLPGDVAALARVFPVLRRVTAIQRIQEMADAVHLDPFQLRRRAVGALRTMLATLAGRGRLVLWIDDLQWADADSMQLLDELIALPHAPAMLTILSFRREEIEVQPFLRALIARDSVTVVPIEPLSDADSRVIIDALLPAVAGLGDDARLRLTSEAAGSPFVLEQLARYAATPSSTAATPTLSTLFNARLESLSPRARLFLETLAVCGRPMAPAVLCDASGIEKDRHSLIVTLRASHLIRSSGSSDRIEPYHDRIREAVASRVSIDAARGIHSRVAASLEIRDPGDCESLFEHYRSAGHDSLAAVQAGLAADKAAAALAFDRAASFYRYALSLNTSSPDAATRQRQLAVALANAGRPAEAAAAYLDAARHANRGDHVTLQRAAAEQFLIGGHIDQGLAQLGQVLNSVGLAFPKSPRAAAVRLLWQRARLQWRGLNFHVRQPSGIAPDLLLRLDACWAVAAGLALVDIVSASCFIPQHLRLALDAGEPFRIAKGMAIESASRHADWTFRRTARAFSARSASLAQQLGTPQAEAMQLLGDSISACATGQWRRAHTASQRCLSILRDHCVGVTWEITIAQNMFIWSLMYMGELGEVSRLVPILMSDALARGNLYLATEFATRANFVWLAADDPDGGERETNAAIARWSQHGFHRQHFSAMLARVQTALYRGDGRTAWLELSRQESKLRASMLMQVQALRVEYTYLRGRAAIAMAMAEPSERRWPKIANDAGRRIAREAMPWSTPIGLLIDAGIASVEGLNDDAAAALSEAVERFDGAEMSLYAAIARRRLSELGGANHQALRRRSDQWMVDQRIKNPECFVRMFAPGFRDRTTS